MILGVFFLSLVLGFWGVFNKYLVEFWVGKMFLKGIIVILDKWKGLVYIQQMDDLFIYFCWKDRMFGNVEDDLIIFFDDCEFKWVLQCFSGRVYVLKFKVGFKWFFFWMQEFKIDQDEEYCWKVNEYLNNFLMFGVLGVSGSSGYEFFVLGGEGGLQSLLGNMSYSQFMQFIGLVGFGGLGGLGVLIGFGLVSLLGSSGFLGSSFFFSFWSQLVVVILLFIIFFICVILVFFVLVVVLVISLSFVFSFGNGVSIVVSLIQFIQLSDFQSILVMMNVLVGLVGGQ